MTTTLDPVQNLLDRLNTVWPVGDGKWSARCPAHDDSHASLSVSTGNDGRALVHCHTGCEPADVCRAVGLTLQDLFAEKTPPKQSRRIVATYDYRDADGTLLYQVVRYEPKTFKQRRRDGNGGWVWNLKGVSRVLYRLPELTAADPARTVYVAEGEKDVGALVSIGLVATCNPQGANKWSKLSDDSVLHGRRVVIIQDKDDAGRKHALDVASRLHGRAAEVRVVETPDIYKDPAEWIETRDGLTSEELVEQLDAAVAAARPFEPAPEPQPQPPEDDGRPEIKLTTNEHRVVCATVDALNADPELYQRGGLLARVLRDPQPTVDVVKRSANSATIRTVPQAYLRERMTKYVRFTKFVRQDGAIIEVPAHPPGWLVGAVDARGEWEGIRPLLGISDTPVLRNDGSIWQTPGYDVKTGVLFEPGVAFPVIGERVSRSDACRASDSLLEVVCDFRFESEDHRAAWLAGLLTPLARFAFAGPSPLFLIDANVRAAGKGLLSQTIGWVILGHEMPVSSYVHDTNEMRKKITAIAMAGDRLVLLDNLEGTFGNDALDRALTTTRWKDRILGKNEQVDLPLLATWYGTGNNVAVAADTARRIIHIRLDVLEEHPENRSDFRHPDLISWLASQRGRLMVDALTILSGYLQAGRPSHDLKPFGSFEGWSGLVREAVVWVGLPDPCRTRIKLTESADTTGDSLQQLVSAWRGYDPDNEGIVVAEMLRDLYPPQRDKAPADDLSNAMRAALENLIGCPAGKTPSPRTVGNRLRHFRRRVVGCCYLDTKANEYHRGGSVWRLHEAIPPL